MAIADELFTAMERGDATAVQELWNDDIVVWHSGDRADNDHGRALRVIRWFLDNTTQRRYEVLDRRDFDGGFVQQHVLHATGINGAVLAMRVCIVIRLAANGRISRIDEYFDPREVEPLF